MTTYVLVSGAWHAGWCWERVVPLLQERGQRAIAVDLAGMGSDPTPLAAVNLGVWVDQVARLIHELDEPVVLVGHSRGGVIISEVAERAPAKVSTLIYVAGFLVPQGKTLMDMAMRLPASQSNALLAGEEEGTVVVDPEAVGSIFYNRTEAGWVTRAQSLLTPEPVSVFSTPLGLSEASFGSVRRAYIECTEDNAVPLELQRLMQADLPCAAVCTLETDHSPFYSAPEQLVSGLEQVSEPH